jgi:hypothetical protein
MMKLLIFMVAISSLVACGEAPKKSKIGDPSGDNTNNSTNGSTNNVTVTPNNQTNNSTNNTTNNVVNNSVNNTTNNSTNTTNNSTNTTNNSTNNTTNNGQHHSLHVQLVWSTPLDVDPLDMVGTDMDVHVAHADGSLDSGRTDLDNDGIREPWGHALYDCYWQNSSPSWGDAASTLDDPSQDVDDTNGSGPENINLEQMQPITYRVGAAYYNDSGLGGSTAVVKIFVDGILEYEGSVEMEAEGVLWEVAWVDGATGEVLSRDTPNGPLLFSPIP